MDPERKPSEPVRLEVEVLIDSIDEEENDKAVEAVPEEKDDEGGAVDSDDRKQALD